MSIKPVVQLERTGSVHGARGGQTDRLLSLATAPSIEIAILPDTGSPGVVPWHNFVLREPADGGPTSVSTELVLGAQDDVTDPESVAVFEHLWERLWEAATHGREALELISRAG